MTWYTPSNLELARQHHADALREASDARLVRRERPETERRQPSLFERVVALVAHRSLPESALPQPI